MADQAPAQSPAAPVVVRRRVVLGSGTASAPLQPPTFRQGTTIDVNALNPQSRRVRRRRADSEDDEAPLSSSAPAHDGRAAPHSANVAEKSSRKHTAPQSSTPGIEHGRVSPSLTPPSTPPSTSRPPSIYGHSAPIQDSPGLTKDLLPRAAALASSTHGLPGLRSLLASTAGATLFNVRNHALFAAAASDRVSILRFLLREGAQLDHLEPSKHRTALHEACARGSARAVSVLLKADRGRIRRLQANEPDGNDSSLSDAPGYIEHAFRPVRSARLRTNNEPHRCLLELQDDHGDTPLHLAIRDSARPGSGSSSTGDHLKDFAAVVRYILREPEHKFLHLANDDGDTPLHLAAKLGSPLFVSLILAVLGKDQSSEPSDGSPKPWLTPNNRGKLPLHLLLLPDSIPQGQKNHVHRPISTPTLRLLLKHDAAEQIAIRADPADPATDAFGLACRRIAADELDENAVACLKTLLTLGGKVRDPVAERVCRDLLTVEWADSSVKDGLSVALVEWEAFREQEKANEPEAVEEKAEKKLPAVAEIKRRRFVRVSSTFAKGAKRMAVEEEEDLGHAAEAVKPEFDDDVISLPSTDRGTPKIEQGDEIGVVGMSTEGFASVPEAVETELESQPVDDDSVVDTPEPEPEKPPTPPLRARSVRRTLTSSTTRSSLNSNTVSTPVTPPRQVSKSETLPPPSRSPSKELQVDDAPSTDVDAPAPSKVDDSPSKKTDAPPPSKADASPSSKADAAPPSMPIVPVPPPRSVSKKPQPTSSTPTSPTRSEE